MINRLIELSLKNRVIVVALYIGLAGWGWWALGATPIDAIPDLSDNQVIVFTDWSGRSPQEVEDQVTYPLTVNLQGLPGVRVVRSSSAFGFSMIFAIFEDNVDLYFARTRVLERLNLVSRQMPPGVVPTLGPDATGVGHVFWYTVEGPGHDLRELRALQDWFIRYQLNSVPGVAEVASVGGEVQQYQIDVDPNRLRTYGLPLSRVMDAVMRSNQNVGGNVLESNGSWSIDRVKAKITDLQPGLPVGAKIVAFYDRSELIDNSIDTLRHALIEEILLVTLAHIIFLAHFRSILIVTLPLPLAVLSSFLILYYLNVTSNIMSLAGIAIAIGVLVDAGIVVTENAFRHLEQSGIDLRDRHAVWQTVLTSTKLVGRPIFFSMAII